MPKKPPTIRTQLPTSKRVLGYPADLEAAQEDDLVVSLQAQVLEAALVLRPRHTQVSLRSVVMEMRRWAIVGAMEGTGTMTAAQATVKARDRVVRTHMEVDGPHLSTAARLV